MDPKKFAQEVFEKTLTASIAYRQEFRREVPLTFLLVLPEGKVGSVSAIPGVSKDQMAEVVRKLAAKSGAAYVIVAGEAWASDIPGAPPSLQKDRLEVLTVSVEGPDLKLFAIVRISPQGGILGTPEIGENFSGRFSNLAGFPEDFN
jgi:hypothetical protein